MSRKPATPPMCVAPMCRNEAVQRIILSCPNGEFSGTLCQQHSEALESAMPATFKSQALLKPTPVEALRQALRHG